MISEEPARYGTNWNRVPVTFWKYTPLTCCPAPGPALRRLVGIGLEPGDQLSQVGCRQVLSRHDDIGIARQAGDRLEILQHVVWERIDRSIHDVGRPVADADGVTVGRGAHGAANTDGARRAGHVFDDDGLAERPAHRVAQSAGEGIDRTAGAEWHDQ